MKSTQEMKSTTHAVTVDTSACHSKDDKKKNNKGKKNTKNDNKDAIKSRLSILPWKQTSSAKQLSDKSGASDETIKNVKDNSGKELNKITVKLTSTTTNKTSMKRFSKEKTDKNHRRFNSSIGCGLDLQTLSREVQANTRMGGNSGEHVWGDNSADHNQGDKVKFCRVILPEGSTTVVSAKPGQTIANVLDKLCAKRSISIVSVDAFVVRISSLETPLTPLDVNHDISTLESTEVVIKRRQGETTKPESSKRRRRSSLFGRFWSAEISKRGRSSGSAGLEMNEDIRPLVDANDL
jgi:hypothetical protein